MIATSLEKLRPSEVASPDAWAARIKACWQASVYAIIEVGNLLIGAKKSLNHGHFEKMVKQDLPFGIRTAQMLMAIANDQRITNTKHISHLPASWGTLYELTKLSDEQFETGIQKSIIRPDMARPTAINGARAIMGSRQEPDDSLDYFPTPPWGTRALMEVVLPHLGVESIHSIDEPACGEGHMAEVLKEYCEEVRASDIFDYGYGRVADFLDPSKIRPSVDWIITNPPFEEKSEAFVLEALRQAREGVAMFLRLQWLETVGRYERIFRDKAPTLIAFFAERVNLCKGRWEPDGTTATAYLWLVWVKGKSPQPPFWIPPGQRERLTKPDDAVRFTARPVIARETKAALSTQIRAHA